MSQESSGSPAYQACPICYLTGGFHDSDLTASEGGLHAAARGRIDPRLAKPPSSVGRAEQKQVRHLANEAWKAVHRVSAYESHGARDDEGAREELAAELARWDADDLTDIERVAAELWLEKGI